MPTFEPKGNTRALVLATLAFTVSFYAWSMMGPLGPDLQELMDLSELQLAMLIAVPVLMGSLMRGMGATNGSNDIQYRERSPLVVPRQLSLPPPAERLPQTANWPKDPDVLERRAAREAMAKRDRVKENNPYPLLPSEIGPAGQVRARTATVAPQPGRDEERRLINEGSGILSPSQLGFTSNFLGMFSSKKDEAAPFTGEPSRESLTQPPPGYQTLLNKDIPAVTLDNNAGVLRVVAGNYQDHQGPAHTFTPMNVWDLRLNAGGRVVLPSPDGHTLALVVLQGTEAIVGVAVGFLFLLTEGVGFGQLRRQAEEEDARTVADEKAHAADTLAGK